VIGWLNVGVGIGVFRITGVFGVSGVTVRLGVHGAGIVSVGVSVFVAGCETESQSTEQNGVE